LFQGLNLEEKEKEIEEPQEKIKEIDK